MLKKIAALRGRRFAALMAGILAVAITVPVVMLDGGAAATTSTVRLCQDRAHVVVGRYDIVNDDWTQAGCIEASTVRPAFTVSRGVAPLWGKVREFPFVYYGWSYGLHTHDTILPRRVSRLGYVRATWWTHQRARGVWNAAFDIWFGKHKSAENTSVHGAEIMIWISRHYVYARTERRYWLSGQRWDFEHWRALGGWNYLQFRTVRNRWGVTDLAITPFIRAMVRAGLIKPWWWLLNVEAGFEVWSGGKYLRTTWFNAHVGLKSS